MNGVFGLPVVESRGLMQRACRRVSPAIRRGIRVVERRCCGAGTLDANPNRKQATTLKEAPMQGEANDTQSGGNAIGNPGGSIQDAMEASRSRLAAVRDSVQQRSTEVLQGAEGYIQERPFQAIIYAASVGAVIGLVAGLMLGGERSESSWYRRFL
jgi:ElaB/YqjD/DUF883 family membrane-anchored ribosome-binding protein